MNVLAARIENFVHRLQVVPGPAERLAILVERADRLPALSPGEQNDANLVRGCVSRVWLAGEVVAGCVQLRGDADSRMVKGLVTFLWEIAHDTPAAELAAAAEEVPGFVALGLASQISPTRLFGIAQVWHRMREIARGQVRTVAPVSL